LAGDGAGADIVFGGGKDANIYFDGADFIVNSLNVTANDEVHFTNFDLYTFDNPVKAAGYQSSDGTAGATAGPYTTITSITVKNGLVTALSGS